MSARVLHRGAVAAIAGAVLVAAVPLARAVSVGPDSPGCVLAPAPELGLSETNRVQVDQRLLDLTVHSQAMRGDQHVNVLLPVDYDATGATRYPVLYLLHGAFGSYRDWAAHGVESMVGNRPLIVVMPDDGPDGSYSDWYGTLAGTSDPPPAWESYHLRELVPFVDQTFPTNATRAGRFIAGLSSGGGGTMKYAAANPGMFGAAGSFSGAVDTDADYPFYPTISEALWMATLIPGSGPDGHCTWGDPYTQRVVWLDNNPTSLAENLQGTALWLAWGNGNDPNGGWDPVEAEIARMNQLFVEALGAAGLGYSGPGLYGDGTHTWSYWEQDFKDFLAWLDVTQLPSPPATFSYRSARPSFSAWDWHFGVHREVREFLYLRNISATGFTVTGSGSLDVTTAPLYVPGRSYTVTAGGGQQIVAADPDGRLAFTLDLGPSHQVQQYRFEPDSTADWVSLDVAIAG